MPLHLYTDVYASGSVPLGWVPTRGGTLKYPVRNPAVRLVSAAIAPRQWQKVIKQGNNGAVIILSMRLVKWLAKYYPH